MRREQFLYGKRKKTISQRTGGARRKARGKRERKTWYVEGSISLTIKGQLLDRNGHLIIGMHSVA